MATLVGLDAMLPTAPGSAPSQNEFAKFRVKATSGLLYEEASSWRRNHLGWCVPPKGSVTKNQALRKAILQT